ncbi:hypothetical protein FQA39_LY18604 [Lamprigera yunnana]|nr:hypothetical protein FQA39_LY18604 [Lamprigera yunnana]
MNVDRQEEEVTVQGVGSPVPARGELGAGSPGSIIGHCTVVEVGDQAFPPRLNTGTETSTPGTSGGNTPYEWDEAYPPPLRESTPLGRLKKLQISPTMSDRTRQEETPSNIAYLDYTWSDEAGTSVKRKRRYTNSPTDDAWKKEITVTARLANSYRKSIEKIKNEIKNLGKLIGENINTKREIKEVSNKLRSLATVIGTAEMQDLLQSLGRQRNNSDYDTVITNLTEEIQEGKEREEMMNRELEQYRQDEDEVRDELMRELEQYRQERDEAREERESALRQLAEIRADAERLKYILSTDRTEEVKITRNDVEKAKCYKDFEKIASKEWEEDAYRASTVKVGKPSRHDADEDIAAWRPREAENTQGYAWDSLVQQFPELEEVEEEVGYLTITTTSKKGGIVQKKDRHLFKIKSSKNEEACYNILMKLAIIRQEEDMRNRLTLFNPMDMNSTKVQKDGGMHRYEKRHIAIDHRDVVTEYDDSMSGDDPREYENGSGNVADLGTETKERVKVQGPKKDDSTTDQLDQESKKDLLVQENGRSSQDDE